jgi:hypothetical protein
VWLSSAFSTGSSYYVITNTSDSSRPGSIPGEQMLLWRLGWHWPVPKCACRLPFRRFLHRDSPGVHVQRKPGKWPSQCTLCRGGSVGFERTIDSLCRSQMLVIRAKCRGYHQVHVRTKHSTVMIPRALRTAFFCVRDRGGRHRTIDQAGLPVLMRERICGCVRPRIFVLVLRVGIFLHEDEESSAQTLG